MKSDSEIRGGFAEIARQELIHVENAQLEYKDLMIHCTKAADFFFNSIDSVKKNAFLTYPFIGQIYSHSILAVLSATRLHFTESMLNLRLTLEATAWCLYSLAHLDKLDVYLNSNGSDNKLKARMYKWLETKYPKGNKSFKERKDLISEKITIHSNLINATQHTQITDQSIITSFFDIPKQNAIEANLWLIANTLLNCTEFLYRVNKDYAVLVYCKNFETVLLELRQENDKLQHKYEVL